MRKPIVAAMAGMASAVWLMVGTAMGAAFVWNGGASGDWQSPANWLVGGSATTDYPFMTDGQSDTAEITINATIGNVPGAVALTATDAVMMGKVMIGDGSNPAGEACI